MPRPRLRRWVTSVPKATYFKPQGIPLRDLEDVCLSIEGLEALRLADLEGMTAEAAAVGMGVSRHTFGRVLTEARAAVARALVAGAALRIEGGHYEVAEDQNDEKHTLPEQTDASMQNNVGPTTPAKEHFMRQGCATQKGQGSGQGRCGQGQGKGGRGQGQCGQGKGRGMGQADSAGVVSGNAGSRQTGTNLCVCPTCGQTAPHTPGTACATMRCPACGTAMTRQ
jgi:predicted DNA-binding protein (UPF0251 family)